MEAKDTVIELFGEYLVNDETGKFMPTLRVAQNVAKDQAEISFKAGIREVVEWFNLQTGYPKNDCWCLEIERDWWQAKLRDWRL